MLWVLKRTVSMRRFFWALKNMLKLMDKKIFTILSKPMYMYALQITKEEFDMEARKLFKSDKGKF